MPAMVRPAHQRQHRGEDVCHRPQAPPLADAFDHGPLTIYELALLSVRLAISPLEAFVVRSSIPLSVSPAYAPVAV